MRLIACLAGAAGLLVAGPVAGEPPAGEPATTDVIVQPVNAEARLEIERMSFGTGAEAIRDVPSLAAEIWRVPTERVGQWLQDLRQTQAITAADYAAEYRSLFVPTDPQAPLNETQAAALERLRASGNASDIQIVRLRSGGLGANSLLNGFGAADGLPDGSLLLNLAPGRDLLMTRRQSSSEAGTINWRGDVRPLGSTRTPGAGSFAVEGDDVLGFFTVGQDTYNVRPLGEGLHAVARIRPGNLPPEHPRDDEDAGETEDELLPLHLPPRAEGLATEVRIAVAYTSAAGRGLRALYNADPAQFVAAAISFVNQTFDESGVAARLTTAGSREVMVNDGWNYDQELAALVNPDDGRYDELHAWRRSVRANALLVLVDMPTSCGQAAAILPPAPASFALVHYSCAMDPRYFSLAHEIGHLLGARHDTDGKNHPFPYGRGYRHENQFRTIMARTGGTCLSCARIPRWAHPDRMWNGVPTGTRDRNHDARAIDETAPLVATYEGE